MSRVTKRHLAVTLHSVGRTVEEISDTLKVPPVVVGEWLEVPADDMYVFAVSQNNYARMFSGVLRFRDAEAVRVSVEKIDALYRGFVEAGNRRGIHQAQLMALIGKNRAESIGNAEGAELFRDWLISHMEVSV